MPVGGYDPEFAARVLADAVELGDAKAAERHGVSTKTVERYRKRMASDPALSGLVREKNAAVSLTLAELRVAAMRDCLEALRVKIQHANVRSVAGALKIIGDLHAGATILEAGRHEHRSDPEGAGSATHGRAGHGPVGEASPPHVAH